MDDVRALEDYNYHVFLSFIDEGPCRKFVNDLYKGLVGEGFRTFRHDVERVELEKVIKRSMISIIVLSERYMYSRWCLDELAMIIECRKRSGHRVLPVFYDFNPPQLKNLRGSIKETTAWFEKEFKVETVDEIEKKDQLVRKLKEWSEALGEASYLSVTELQNQAVRDESTLIQEIIEVVEDKADTSGKDADWNAKKINLVNREISELPENPYCPALVKLFLQQNPDLAEIPPEFFESMPALQVLDLSNTSIKSLPPSISKLVKLQKLYLRGCEFLMELPPEIGALENLEVLDLEGTELICLPKEIGGLVKLECLKVSLDKSADEYRGSKAIFPMETLLKFSHLKELSIDVYPDSVWWDVELVAILIQLYSSTKLHTLKLFLPTVQHLQQFLQLPHRILNFRFIVGRHEKRIISPLQPHIQDNFEKLPKCLKCVNSEGNLGAIFESLTLARALFLDHNWTIGALAKFNIVKRAMLEYCLLVQCNAMITIVDGDCSYQPHVLEHLRYLSVHGMKNLKSIWKGPIYGTSLYSLTTLALHTCPNLTTIFNLQLLRKLVHLTELIVDDCPQIKSLVSLEPPFLESNDCFLPRLEKISLLHLPELVSISSGLHISPELERMVIYNCPQLKSLYPVQICCHDVEEIKGQTAWWEALEWSGDQHEHLAIVFVPLGRDGDLMDQLAEAVQTSLNCQQWWPVVNPENEVLKSDSGFAPRPMVNPKDEVLKCAIKNDRGFPRRLVVNPENEVLKSDILEMWRNLIDDLSTRKYVLQPDFVIMMVAYQDTLRRNLFEMDDRFTEALDVLKQLAYARNREWNWVREWMRERKYEREWEKQARELREEVRRMRRMRRMWERWVRERKEEGREPEPKWELTWEEREREPEREWEQWEQWEWERERERELEREEREREREREWEQWEGERKRQWEWEEREWEREEQEERQWVQWQREREWERERERERLARQLPLRGVPRWTK